MLHFVQHDKHIILSTVSENKVELLADNVLTMLTKNQKKKVLEELNTRFDRQKIAIFTDFQGVSVGKSQVLRRMLKKENAEYKVAKKTIIDRAIKEKGIEFSTKDLQGEIGIAFGYGDQVAPAKALQKFARENATFKILGAILEGKIIDAKGVIALAKLPAREVLLAQVVGAMQGPVRGLAVALQGNIRNLANVLNAIKDKK